MTLDLRARPHDDVEVGVPERDFNPPFFRQGRVVSVDGTPLPGAILDVWQANDQGFYDVQQPDRQPRTNGRGLFTAD
ncbi:MAG TPA: hypothetical protein VF223_27980, partial [Trebonia sp.]